MIPTLDTFEASQLQAARRAVSLASVDDAVAELEVESRDLEERRAARQYRRLVRATPQCGGCRRFLRNPAHECPGCGYLDGRGYRP